MPYTLEIITPEARERITRDAGPKQERYMLRTSFWEEKDLTWAVNRESDSYLTSAPHLYPVGSPMLWFYFYFQSKMYCFRVGSEARPLVDFYEEKPSSDIYENFKQELRNAFSVYSLYGHKYREENAFTPIFSDEGVQQ